MVYNDNCETDVTSVRLSVIRLKLLKNAGRMSAFDVKSFSDLQASSLFLSLIFFVSFSFITQVGNFLKNGYL